MKQPRLDRVDVRTKLPPRNAAYWHKLSEGKSVGFRKLARGSQGTWLARYRNGSCYVWQPLGDFRLLAENQRFDAARKAAESWFRHLDLGGSTDVVTVKAACESYVSHLHEKSGVDSARDATGRFRRLIDSDPLGTIDLRKLAPRHLADWRSRTLAKGGTRLHYNRNATSVRAALNLALSRRSVASDMAWKTELKPLRLGEGEGKRKLTLDRDDIGKLIAHASDEFRPLLVSLAVLPLRPGEVAQAKVQDFNLQTGSLHVTGKKRSRTVPLSTQAIAHFRECARGKLPQAWLVSRSDGGPWNHSTWRRELKAAAARAGLPAAVCLYELRHLGITALLVNGLDVLTVAKVSGTSIAMIQATYGHLVSDRAREALGMLAAQVQP